MKEEHPHDQLLEQWTKHRRDDAAADAPAGFTREVMGRIAATADTSKAPVAPRQPAPRVQRLALATACAAAGLGKFLIVMRLSI